ncbi:MAG: hypothetical protein LUC23_06355, partial [Prevotellaceae bacterium]|nr:hypothetical protein [Prevotellaceae bacterium]
MQYRIFFLMVSLVVLLFGTGRAAAQEVNGTDEMQDDTEKPVILYTGTPKKYEIADIKVEGAQNYEDYVII